MGRLQRRWASSAPPLRKRLMEKPGATAAHRSNPQDGAAWGERGGTQHTQYIRRLADLRDELINQEETALARALDRLRLHSINNRDAARYRLKIKDQAGESTKVGVPIPQGVSFPRPMITTVEKFRQMRPQRRPPVIFPLQGKQLIDPPPVAANGSSTTRSSTGDGPRGAAPAVEDTVKANLQRLIQPTSSIPNIGRKALRQESLELKPQSLHNMRSRVYKTTRPHGFMSPFMLNGQDEDGGYGGGGGGGGDGGGSGLSTSRPDSDGEFFLSPHAYKLGPMTDGDRINMDKLNQYYYICCLPDTPASREGTAGGAERQGSGEEGLAVDGGGVNGKGGGGGDRRRLTLSTPRQQQQQQPRKGHAKLSGQVSSRSRRANSERSHVSRPFSDRSSMSLVVSSDTELEASANPRHPYRRSMDTAPGSDRLSLPVIEADDGEGVFVSNSYPHPQHGPAHSRRNSHNNHYGGVGDGAGDIFVTQRERSKTSEMLLSTERRRRHIVVDMPNIIFNAATPDISREPHAVNSAVVSTTERPGALSKTLKQNEIRHRELQNLLEDVKELNKRTETLNTHAQNSDLEAVPSPEVHGVV